MINEKIETLSQFKTLLDKLKSDLYNGYFFRGQADASWPLIPSAFRKTELKRRADNYPIKESEITNWKNNQKIPEIINGWSAGIVKNGRILNRRDRIFIYNLFNRLIIVMQYNFDLTLYWSNPKVKRCLLKRDKKLIKIWKPDFWCEESTFINYFERIYPQLIVRTSVKDNRLISKPCPEEDLTGLDETFPQHYDLSTTTLDWSLNLFIAFYFGLDKQFERNSPNGLYLPSRCEVREPANYFSLFLYKQLQQDSPVVKMERPKLINNPRADAQQGVFTYFTKPCSFYLLNGEFPSIDNYARNCTDKEIPFELQKFNFKYSNEILNFIENILEEKGINKSSLLLDQEIIWVEE